MFLRILPLILSSLLAGAHFLRSGNLLLVLAFAAAPLLLFVRRRWVLIALQVICYFEAFIWLQTTLRIVNQRLAMGDDWLRVVFILTPVALLAVGAGLLLNSQYMRQQYPPADAGISEEITPA